MIEGARLVPLRQIGDERGKVMHMLRSDAPYFAGFGEIYFSTVNPGAVKAWHRQNAAIRHYAVPMGRVKVVLYDERPASGSFGAVDEVVLGEADYQLLVIPPMVWSGFVGLGDAPALVADCASLPHDAAKADRRDAFDPAMPCRWGVVAP